MGVKTAVKAQKQNPKKITATIGQRESRIASITAHYAQIPVASTTADRR